MSVNPREYNVPYPMKPKSRVIGDPLKKFKKGPSVIQEAPEEIRKAIEQTMEEDHKNDHPFRSAYITSSLTGIPDKWWFDKARSLGCVFEDERTFWEEQRKALESEPTSPEERAAAREEAERLLGKDALLRLMGVETPAAPKITYTWEQVAALKKLPDHESVPPEQKGTFFAMCTIQADPKMVLNAYLKWGMQAIQDMTTDYMMKLTDKVRKNPKMMATITSNLDEQLKFLLDDVDWKAVEDVLKVGAAELRKRVGEMRIEQMIAPLRYLGTPGELYNTKTGRGTQN